MLTEAEHQSWKGLVAQLMEALWLQRRREELRWRRDDAAAIACAPKAQRPSFVSSQEQAVAGTQDLSSWAPHHTMVDDSVLGGTTWKDAGDTESPWSYAHAKLTVQHGVLAPRQHRILLAEGQTSVLVGQHKEIGIWLALSHDLGRSSVYTELACSFLEQKEWNIKVRH